jgi:hypothetical protein
MQFINYYHFNGKYTRWVSEWDAHFGIRCACGGKKGSHYRSISDSGKGEGFTPRVPPGEQYIFWANELWFLDTALYENHRESKGQEPLIVECDNCGREFDFTWESFNRIFEGSPRL